MPQLESVEGLPVTTLTIDMIHAIMTDTVFGGYHDEDEDADDYEGVASWKDDIVYFLQHLIDVQPFDPIGVATEVDLSTIRGLQPSNHTGRGHGADHAQRAAHIEPAVVVVEMNVGRGGHGHVEPQL